MKKKILTLIVSAVMLLSLSVPALAEPVEETPPPAEWTTLYENRSSVTGDFFYKNKICQNGEGKRVESFAVETVPGGSVYPIVATADSLYEAMTPEELIAAAEEKGLNVLALINADFFYSTARLPLGGVIVDGEYISNPDTEDLLVFGPGGAFYSQDPKIKITLTNRGGGEYYDSEAVAWVSNVGKTVTVNHLNKERNRTGGIFLYTTAYHTEHTDTTRNGWAVRFKVLSGKITVSGSVELQVEEIIPKGTDYAIGEGHMVLTCPSDGPYPDAYKSFAVGDRVTLTTTCSDPRLLNAQWATGCGDLLVERGQITDSTKWDKTISAKAHPRTALGIKADGSVVAVVIDGRYNAYSAGATMYELARELRDMGCQYAVNLDGGGSSVMMLKTPGSETCSILNRPSDGKTRKGSTYILFVSDEQPDGRAKTLHLEEDGSFVFAGGTALLTPFATDAAGDPAEGVEDVIFTAEKGTVVDGIYTAGTELCDDTITMRSPDGQVQGSGTIHVTDKLDSLTVTDLLTGATPKLGAMEPGDTADLMVSGTYMRRDVILDGVPVEYTVTEGLGEITPEGTFTATGLGASDGAVTVSVGGVTVTLPVSLKLVFEDIQNHWAKAYIKHLYDEEIVGQTEDNLFRPNDAMERWEFATILWRAVGSPLLEGECTFTDVPTDSEYYEAAKWGQIIGLIQGTGVNKFDPDGNIDRQQAFTLVYRLLSILRRELPDVDVTVLAAYPDSDSVSPYAVEAVSTLIRAGVISGSNGYLNPRSGITRAELCKITCEAVLGWTPPAPPSEEDPETPVENDGLT